MLYDCLIVGSGHAGVQAALTLRQLRFEGSIGLLGEEPDAPYERPPLSKDYLSGHRDFESLLLRRANVWGERRIDLLLGQGVVAVNPRLHRVELSDGMRFGYRTLIWATGGRPRRLPCPGGDLAGVHTIRTRADVDALRAELDANDKVVIIGGGYIGLETAAVLSGMGKKVTVLEAQDRVLARVAAEPLSRFYESEHRANGVDVRLEVAVQALEGRNGRVTGVRLADGTLVPGGLVIVGIGIVPAVEPLLVAGAQGGNGIEVDAFCRASVPYVFVIGDCSLHRSEFAQGRLVRIESIQNATDQAVSVAKTMTGAPVPYRSLPWFWSKQYDLNLQSVGIATGFDQYRVRGDPRSRSFSIVYLHEGRILALDCVNATKDFVQGRTLIGRDAPSSFIDAIRDPKTSLKDLGAERGLEERTREAVLT